VEYLSENKFNVYLEATKLGEEPTIIIRNAEVIENPEKASEIIVRTETE
jgi:hypothetical protein